MEGDHCRLCVCGDLERATIRSLIDELRTAEQSSARSITIDLADCGFIDRVGVCVLLDAARRGRRDGRPLSVANPTPAIDRVFRLVALHRTIRVEEDGLP